MDVTWIKLATDIFENPKIQHIRSQKNGTQMALFWIALLSLAGSCNDNGMIYVTPKVPYTEKGLSEKYHFDLPVVKSALSIFESLDMICNDHGFLCIINWSKYQSIEKLSALSSPEEEKEREREKIRERVKRHRQKKDVKTRPSKTVTCNADVTEETVTCNADVTEETVTCNADVTEETVTCNADVTDGAKEEKVPQKEETQEGERDLDIDNSSNSSSGGECACARVEPPLKNTLEEVLNEKFFCHYARYPTRKELGEVCEMMKKEKQDSLSDDELYLLEVSFASSVKAQVKETRYLAGCFRNFEKRGIKTLQQYEEERARMEARRQQIAEENAKNENAPSYGDSNIFWEAALAAGLKDW